MKRNIFLLLSIFISLVSYAQALSFTDVMVYKSDGSFGNNDNWQYTESQTVGLYKKSETRYYTSFGREESFVIDYWTWRGERYTTQQGLFADANEGMSIEMKYVGDTMAISFINNGANFLFVKLDSLFLFYCANEDEGVSYQMLPGVGNSLRNNLWDKYDYALIPPGKMAVAEFKSLQGLAVFPASLPSKTIIQLSLYGAFSEINPWDSISSYIRAKETIVDEVIYFSISSNDYSNIVSGYLSPFVGFESRYHFKIR